MKSTKSDLKRLMPRFGRQIGLEISNTQIDGTQIQDITSEDINYFSLHYEGSLLTSVMKQLDITSSKAIEIGTCLNPSFLIWDDSNSADVATDLGQYFVYSCEKQEDSDTYKVIAYDGLFYAMQDYEDLGITYPITVRAFLKAICNKIGLSFDDTITFPNYDKEIKKELYLDVDGNSLGYTYRDVLTEIAQVSASTICINDAVSGGKTLVLRYINNTQDTINEDFLKDTDVSFGEKFGPINSLVLSRSADSDITNPVEDAESIAQNGICQIKIKDNQIMNWDDRETYMQAIFNVLDGVEYYINDLSSLGVIYYDLLDKYNVSVGNNTYPCIMFNDEIIIDQGVEEKIYSDKMEESVSEIKKSDKQANQIRRISLIVNKQEGEIEALVEKTEITSNTINSLDRLVLENALPGLLYNLSIKGQMSLVYPTSSTQYGIVPYGNEVLYPSSELFTKSNILLIDSNEYELDINFLNYINNDVCDEFVYEDGKCKIIRRVGINSLGEKYALANEIIEDRADIDLQVSSSSIIKLKSFTGLLYSSTYLIQNEYTNTFVPQIDLISRINVSSNKIKIQSNKISLEGYTTINDGFSIDLDGNMSCQDANINGELVTRNGVLTNLQFSCELWGWTKENVYENQGGGFIGFNYNDALSSIHKSFLNFTVRIPEHFTVKSAKIYFRHTPVIWSNPDGTLTQMGSVKNMKIYRANNLGQIAYGAYNSEFEIGGVMPSYEEITDASSHTFGDAVFEQWITDDFSNEFNTHGIYNIFAMTDDEITSVPSINNAYTVLGSESGILTGELEIIGYTSNV